MGGAVHDSWAAGGFAGRDEFLWTNFGVACVCFGGAIQVLSFIWGAATETKALPLSYRICRPSYLDQAGTAARRIAHVTVRARFQRQGRGSVARGSNRCQDLTLVTCSTMCKLVEQTPDLATTVTRLHCPLEAWQKVVAELFMLLSMGISPTA
jgi:hypothetical protein